MDPTSASWRFPARRYVLTYTPLNCQLDKPEGRPSRMVICDRRPHNMVGNTFFGPSTVELIRVVLLAWSWVLDVHPEIILVPAPFHAGSGSLLPSGLTCSMSSKRSAFI